LQAGVNASVSLPQAVGFAVTKIPPFGRTAPQKKIYPEKEIKDKN
jgi:hypothetical protein